MRKVYQGARNPRTGEQIFPGWARGSEAGWGSYIVNPAEPVRVAFLRSLVFNDPAWDPRRVRLGHRRRVLPTAAFPSFAATSRDYRRSRRGAAS